MGGIVSFMYSSVFWVSEDTKYVLPALGANPDTVMVSGFSGGAMKGMYIQATNAAEIKGSALTAGSTYGQGWRGTGGSDMHKLTKGESYSLDYLKEQHQRFSDEGKIDNVSNLKDRPIHLITCLKDDSMLPALQKLAEEQFTHFGANVKRVEFDRPH